MIKRKPGGLAEWLGWYLDTNTNEYGYDHYKDGYAYFYKQTNDKWAEIQKAYNQAIPCAPCMCKHIGGEGRE